MLALLVSAVAGSAHLDLAKIIQGSWVVESWSYQGNSSAAVRANKTIAFDQTDTRLLLKGVVLEDGYEFSLNFRNKGVFVMTSATDGKVAEFEFFATMFPHLTATGAWLSDSTFTAEMIASTSAHLSIFNRTSGDTKYFLFSKEVDRTPKSYLEKNAVMLLSFGFIAFKVVRREFAKRQLELEMKKRAEEEMKRLEEEEEDAGECKTEEEDAGERKTEEEE